VPLTYSPVLAMVNVRPRGRFAMIDDGIRFQLVPWQPLLERRIGQHITGTVRDAGGIEWNFGRKRGLGI
jgi:Protein of unknown function (DUF3363)